jgi:hypothetical protein
VGSCGLDQRISASRQVADDGIGAIENDRIARGARCRFQQTCNPSAMDALFSLCDASSHLLNVDPPRAAIFRRPALDVNCWVPKMCRRVFGWSGQEKGCRRRNPILPAFVASPSTGISSTTCGLACARKRGASRFAICRLPSRVDDFGDRATRFTQRMREAQRRPKIIACKRCRFSMNW